MSPDQIVGGLLVAVCLLALAPRRRPRCSSCGTKLAKAEAKAERFAQLDPKQGTLPLCVACFLGTFV